MHRLNEFPLSTRTQAPKNNILGASLGKLVEVF